MGNMGVNDIRKSFLDFFESKQHLKMESFSLVPKNDKSLLLINAGMAPLKPYFTGLAEPPCKRVTTCQKCIRTGDIDRVGKTSRHGTFFEMLGNFSFGDYFKEEIIPWAWEYITEVLQIPKDKLYVTVHINDDEAEEIWIKKTDIKPSRIFRLDEDNFWEVGEEGPCGPCSEIHYDRGVGEITTIEDFVKASDDDRIVEFWNLVFTQYNKKDGEYVPLKNKNIDTGMGLERISTIMQGVNSIFEIDTIKKVADEVGKLAGIKLGEDKQKDISLRIITDHIRSTTMLISDGVLPSNEGRGYVLRRILRRAARHGRLLGIQGIFLHQLCRTVIDTCESAYPELRDKQEYIEKVIRLEEERFAETIDAGSNILMEYIEEMEENHEKVLSGDKAFKLYDTYGFPYELTEEILSEKGFSVDTEGFNKEMEEQRARARAARGGTNYMGREVSAFDNISNDIETYFEGYDNVEYTSKVLEIIKDDEFVSNISSGDTGVILADHTPFYAEMGGQVGDTGLIFNDKFKAKVVDCKKNLSGKIMHFVEVLEGELSIDDKVTLSIDVCRRENICKNHTATHLLHKALKEVLGDHVQQKGSYVDEGRLRFDFTHFEAMTGEELKRAEDLVNAEIMKVHTVDTIVMNIEEAKKNGAVALFDDKYTEDVRVVGVGEFSKELCGGTHVSNSGVIGLFKIVSEAGVAAGIRRIEALTGSNAIEFVERKENILKDIEKVLKCSEKDILSKLQAQLNELKEKEKEIQALKNELASGFEDELLNNIKEIGGVKVINAALKDIDGNSLRDLADKLRDKLQEGVVVLGSVAEGKVMFVAMASKSVVSKGIHCGKIVKEIASIAGGGGGGRPDMAQAGAKNPDKLNEAIERVTSLVEEMVK